MTIKPRPMRIVFLFLCLLMTAAPLQAEGIYKWVDEDGRVHFSDEAPRRGQRTERIVIRQSDAQVPAPKMPATMPKSPTPNFSQLEAKAKRTQAAADTAYRARKCREANDVLAHLLAAPDPHVQEAQRIAAEKNVRRDVAKWCN